MLGKGPVGSDGIAGERWDRRKDCGRLTKRGRKEVREWKRGQSTSVGEVVLVRICGEVRAGGKQDEPSLTEAGNLPCVLSLYLPDSHTPRGICR